MSIPIKINPLGVTPYVYIANPLVGKGTKADPVTLSFNPIYFSVDNDTSQLNINTANLALKSDLNSYVPISGGYMTGALTHNETIYLNTTPATNHNFVVNTQVNKNESQLLFTINNNSQSQYTEWFFRDNTYTRYRHELNGGNGILTQFDLVSGEDENDKTSYANFNCKVITQNEFISSYPDSFRIAYGTYGTFWKNDGTNLNLLITNENDQYGSYNDFRPFTVNLSTGQVTLNNSLIITNDENKYVTISDNLGITNNSISTNSSINVGQDLIANGIITSKNVFLHQNDNLDITSTFTSDHRLVPFQVNDKNGKVFFYPELHLNGTNEIKSRIVLSNRAQNWYPYLEIGVTESNTPYISTNVSNTGNDTELARCDWIKNNFLALSGGTVTGYTSIAGNMAISNTGITTNTGITINGIIQCQNINCQNIVNTKTYFKKTSTTLNKNNIYAQNTYDNNLIFTDSVNRTLFRIDTFLGPTNNTGARLLTQSRDSSVEAELALRWNENNTPSVTWSYPTNGANNELARCDWVKNQINSISGQDVITVYNGKTGILNNDGTDNSHAYVCFKKCGNSGVLYGNIKLSRYAAVNLKNNCPDLRSGHRLILSVPLYGYYSDDSTISTHFITTTSPVIYDVSANNYKMIDTSTRSFMVGLSLFGGLLLACPRLDTTSISADDLIFFDFIGLCHV